MKSFVDVPGDMYHFFESLSNLAPLALTSSLSAYEQFKTIPHLELMILMLAKVMDASGQYLCSIIRINNSNSSDISSSDSRGCSNNSYSDSSGCNNNYSDTSSSSNDKQYHSFLSLSHIA